MNTDQHADTERMNENLARVAAEIRAALEEADSATGATAFMDNSYYQGYTDALQWCLDLTQSGGSQRAD